MKYIFQFLIILLITFLGEVLKALIPLPVPAGIYGLVIMFFCLKTKLVALERVKDTADFLLAIMPVMFIPAAVGLMDIYREVGIALLYIAIVSVITTLLVMAAAGHATQGIIRWRKGRHHD